MTNEITPSTQYKKILKLMLRKKDIQEWFYPQDFMKPELGDLFVGYEASARLSELFKKYPNMFERKREGKYKITRFKFEDLVLITKIYPEEIVELIRGELNYWH
jgi:hypothetical protein